MRRILGQRHHLFLPRLQDGTLRFRLLTGRPSHEKLYLLSGPDGHRVVTGSANLSQAAFHGRQHEIIITFDDPAAWRVFEDYYQRDYRQSVPVEDEILIGVSPTSKTGQMDIRADPLPMRTCPLSAPSAPGLRMSNRVASPCRMAFPPPPCVRPGACGRNLKPFPCP
ncbi:phospholipase D-like domain-containing protein [Komagataeibacter rhaeticus]|nr:phospholipase D-like domain-containing protein [Komagataeibacter rhaeticus]